MGIHKLMTLIQEKAPKSVKTITLDYLTGKVIACDASMAIYQFLIATQTMKQGMGIGELRDDKGNLTGHLVGMFHRTIQFLENGIKPIWVFDGKPPDLKARVLETRKEQKEKATFEKKDKIETGDLEGAKRMAGRSVKVTWDMMKDAKKLLRLMGCPVVEAPGEAEAQCAVLVKNGLAFATASEDMDSLTFGTKILLRGFNSKKEPIIQIDLEEILEAFMMNQDQFIDLCILCGCDYTTNITGVGPVKAFKYISEQGGVIENVLRKIEKENSLPWKKKKYHIPENFYYKEARELFKNPSAQRDLKKLEGFLKWQKPDEEGLKEFLITQKGFSEVKVDSGLKKLRGCQGKTNQGRLDCFFNQTFKKTSDSYNKNDKNKKGSTQKENINTDNNYSQWYNDPFSIPGKQKLGTNPLNKTPEQIQMKETNRDRIPLPKGSNQSNSQIRLKNGNQSLHQNTISMKLIGKIASKKENLQLNNYSVNDFRETNLSSTNSTLQNQLKEKEQNKVDSISSPLRQPITGDDGILKHIQQKIQIMEDQISKIEYSQDTMRPVLRQIQTAQGQQQLLNQFQKQQMQMLNPKEQEKQQQMAESQYEILKNLKSQAQDQLQNQEELFKKNIDGLKIKKMELDFNLEQSSKFLSSQLRESEYKILDDKTQLQNDIQRKQQETKEDLIKRIEAIKQKQHQNSQSQSQRMQNLYERLDEVQKIYGQRIDNLQQRVKPISEVINQVKKNNESNQIQVQLSKALEEQMRNTVLQIKGTFEEKFQQIQDSSKQETEGLREELSKLNIKIAQQTINMTADNRISELTFKKVKNQTKSVANLSPNSEYNKNKTIDHVQSQSKSLTRKQPQISQSQNHLREEIKKSFEGLESFSLKTSEDINEELENLNGCIESNSSALEKSLYDLQDLKDSQKTQKDIEEFANRIISQFQQFSDYIRNEVSKIRKLILHRQQSADQELKKQDGLIDQLQKLVMSESSNSGQSVIVKLDQIKEHQDALKKHMINTQGYLTREANQIDMKLMQLQDFIVKQYYIIYLIFFREIEPYIPQADDSQNQIEQYATAGGSQKPFSGINKQNISAILEEGAEYLHTEDQLDDSIGN